MPALGFKNSEMLLTFEVAQRNGDEAQRLSTLAALPEDSSLVVSSRGSDASGLQGRIHSQVYISLSDIHTNTAENDKKINKSIFLKAT